ncbi:hypothetical protein CL622_01360 [archaeon]|nr:hypothetical protein [archaeon]|tara:strand:- start:267 stop:953 length:687 start_codon:yes stop_codon:yes gene_type:complete
MFLKNESLELLCEEIPKFPIDWDDLDRGMEIAIPGRNLNGKSKGSLINKFVGIYGERHIGYCLEKVDGILELNIDFNTKDSILFKHPYYLKRVGYNWIAISGGKEKAEYDQFIYVDSLPVIIEVKMSVWRHWSDEAFPKSKPKKSSIEGGLHKFIYGDSLKVVRAVLGRDMGCAFVIPKDVYKDQEQNPDGIYAAFKREGGLFIPFPYERHSFREEVSRRISRVCRNY